MYCVKLDIELKCTNLKQLFIICCENYSSNSTNGDENRFHFIGSKNQLKLMEEAVPIVIYNF